MKYFVCSVVIAVTISSLAMTATAADKAVLGAIYDSSATIPTNIKGINTYPAPPRGFNAVTASDEELATYGLPPRPDKQADPVSFAKWVRAMSSPVRHRAISEAKDMGVYSTAAKHAMAPSNLAAASAVSATPTTEYSSNWSGVVNTNANTVWKGTTSFYYVVSEFSVPVAQQPFGTCDGGYDWEVNWNGIDGWKNGDVLQGGSSSYYYCNSATNTKFPGYCGWVEWYPSYPIICEFTVNPGDDMFVETWSTSGGTNPGNVYIYDYTLQVGGVYQLTYKSGPGLVGNSAEYIVERPCCRSFSNGNFGYPLANYIFSFWSDDYAYTFRSVQSFPGSQSPTTYLVDMLDDAGDQIISYPDAGSAGYEGKYAIAFYDEGCAYSGGCTP
jgi:hypothetical protein